MSMKLSFKEALERQAETKAEHPNASDSQPKANAFLLAIKSIDKPVDFVRLLANQGVSLKRARLSLDRIAQQQVVVVEINAAGAAEFFDGMQPLGVVGALLENQPVDAKRIREKQGLSQPDFACLYGLEVDTLKNWEQGRYSPDGPARTLLNIIDYCPQAVIEARTRGASVQNTAKPVWLSYVNALQSAGLSTLDMGRRGEPLTTGSHVSLTVGGTLSTETGVNNFAWYVSQTRKELSK